MKSKIKNDRIRECKNDEVDQFTSFQRTKVKEERMTERITESKRGEKRMIQIHLTDLSQSGSHDRVVHSVDVYNNGARVSVLRYTVYRIILFR